MTLPAAVRLAEGLARVDGREIRGLTGADALLEAPDLAPELAATLGAVAADLARVDAGPADGWRARFEAEVDAAARDVHARRLHLGPPLDRAVGPRRWPALDTLGRLALVHGDLGPDAIWLDEDLVPVGILGLADARPGDPLVDVAGLLRSPDPSLRALAVEAAAPPLDHDAIARIEAYARAGLLTDLRRAPADPDERALFLERLRLRFDDPPLTRRLLTGGPRRLEPDHPVVAARRALEASPAVRTSAQRADWLGALGAALLAVTVRGDVRHRLGLVARELAARLPHGAPAPGGAPEPGFVLLAHRGVLLLEEAVGAHVLDGLGAAAAFDPALRHVLPALDAASAVTGPASGPPLPEAALEAIADDPLEGLRAALPAVAWAAQLLSRHGEPERAAALLRRGGTTP